MHELRRNRPNPLAAWLALLAILLNALVPAYAHATTAASGRHDPIAAAVCSLEGASAVVPGTAEPAGRPFPHDPSLPSAAHCPYCALGASMGPPCAEPTGSLPAQAFEAPLGVSGNGIRPHFALSPAHAPRAPPIG